MEQGIKELKKEPGMTSPAFRLTSSYSRCKKPFVCLLGLSIRKNGIDSEKNQIQLNLITCLGCREAAFQGGGVESTVIEL